MSSTNDRVLSILLDLEEQTPVELPSQWISVINTCRGLKCMIKVVMLEFRFLTLFEDCIHKWTDAGVIVPQLAIKVEATSQEIARQVEAKEVQNFRKEIKKTKERHRFILYGNKLSKFQKRASNMIHVLTNLNEKINLLKQEIGKAFQILSAQSFQCHSPMRDFDDWSKFVSLIYPCLWELGGKLNNEKKLAENLDRNLLNLLYFLNGLPEIPIVEDFSIQVANVAFRAALVSCQWWATQFDPNKKEDVIIVLSALERKISNFTNPESLDQILRLLKNLEGTACYSNLEVEIFLQDLLPFRRRFEEFSGKCFRSNGHLPPFTLIKQLHDLVICLVQIPEDAENPKNLLLDFKPLILEIESFSCSSLHNGTLLLNLLAKIWLIKVELFLTQKLTSFTNEDISALTHGLEQIKASPEEHTEVVNHILTLTEEVAELLASLHRSSCGKVITGDMVIRTLLRLLLLKVLLFKLDRKLHNCNENSKFLDKHRVQSLLEGLKFLTNVYINLQGEILENGVVEVARVEPIARRIFSLYQLVLTHNFAEEMIENVNLLVSDLLDEIKLIVAQLREICFPVPRSNFPKTNAVGFYDSLLSKLQELMNDRAKLFLPFKQHIEEILADLEFFRHFLGDNLGPEKETEELRDLCRHVINVAYDAEYLVDLIVYGIKSEWHNLILLYDLLLNIRRIKVQVTEVHDKNAYDVRLHNVSQTSRHEVSKTTTPTINDVVLSLNDQQELIIDRLLGGYPKRDIVSIVGMPGIGKTTLAKQVYSSPIVAHHFRIQAWCCVTEVYRRRQLLLEVLSHIIVLTDNILGMSDEDLDFKLHQLLLKQKYLIVMDDMWSTEAWDGLQTLFPDDENGSRILITSRLDHVPLKVKAYSSPHHLRLLSDDECWELLQMKIFHGEQCPKELIKVGQEIAKSCKGLPLTTVTMAGIMERTDREENGWKEIAENLSSRVLDDPQEQCRDILGLSYKLLPDYLKACFLYFGAFLDGQEIPVRKLIRLWIAEGFVQKTELNSLEDLAEDYLKDLIGRNLVICAQPSSRGGTKACRIHDMLRNLCLSKAKADNFLQVISRSNESNTSLDDLDSVLNAHFNDSSSYKLGEHHRVCFYLKRNHFTESRPSGPLVRSLLFFGTSDKYARSSYDISFISHNFKLLKVLDLESINMGPSFPSGIEVMVHLRYLAVSGDVDFVPSSIADLLNLETFAVKGLKGKVNLPDAIWSLKRLRHVHISDVAVINSHYVKVGNSLTLDCLVTLSWLFLPHGQKTKNMLMKFPNLRKLGCIFLESPKWSHFPRLDFLAQLESLKISYYGRAHDTAEFSFPSNLKKLTLSNFRLPWVHIRVIGKLQNLQVLKLLSRAYDGEIWDMVEGEFHNLKFLKLDNLNIVKWNASSDNLPSLEKLVLRNCKHLEEVPSSFTKITTLQLVEVQWCGKSAEESVRRMRDEADEYLKVIITSDLDSRSSS